MEEAIERKGLKTNMGKTKMTVSGERIVSKVDPCSVCVCVING